MRLPTPLLISKKHLIKPKVSYLLLLIMTLIDGQCPSCNTTQCNLLDVQTLLAGFANGDEIRDQAKVIEEIEEEAVGDGEEAVEVDIVET